MFNLGQEVVIETEKRKNPSRLLGWRYSTGRKYLLLETPAGNGAFRSLAPGDGAVLRLKTNGNNIGLGAVYAETLKKTGLLLFLLGNDMEATPLRAHERVQCCIPVLVYPGSVNTQPEREFINGEVIRNAGSRPEADAPPPVKGFIYDISMGGLGFCCREALDTSPRGEVKASFNVAGMGSIEMATIRVRRIMSADTPPAPEGGKGGAVPCAFPQEYAGMFANMDSKGKALVARYIGFCAEWRPL